MTRRVDRESYAGTLRDAMAEQRQTIRNLEQATTYSYEHLRKVVSGHPVVSLSCNKAICAVLGLDEKRLWLKAVSEKRNIKLRTLGALALGAPEELVSVWTNLTDAERLRLIRIADGWVATREAS